MKNLNIKDAKPEDIASFNQIKKDTKSKSAAAALTLILKKWFTSEPTTIKTESSPAQSPNFLEINEANAQAEMLEKLLEAETQKTEELNKVILNLQNQVTQLSEAKPEPIQLTGTQLIYEPSKELFSKIHRVGLYLIKKGQLNRHDHDLAQQVISKLVNYGIKNEYEHIIK